MAALIAASAIFSAPHLAAASPAAVPDNSLLSPPGGFEKPIDLDIGLHIVNIAAIDEVAQQFNIDAYFHLRWKNPRLAYSPKGPDDQERVFQPGEVWIPKIEILNGAAPRKTYDISIRATPDGTVYYAERLHAVISSRFRLERFPFDSQTLLVLIHPFLVDKPRLVFHLDRNAAWTASEFTSYTSLAQWQLKGAKAKVDVAPTYGGMTVPEFRFEISVQRHSSFYLWKVFLPLTLMVVLSWAAFWISPDDLQSQLQVGVTTILTVIAFAFAISATMPRVPYLTYIDGFFLQCYIFVFIAILELMIVHVAHRSDRSRDLGLRIRRMSRFIVPIAFAISNIWLATRFLG
ncbi:MAG TPA: hypothetical protein VMT58_02935 [Candidatus Binataceae bacterium]|nr:hypothetical protein [Candidatus Binataceae bacterium]